MMDTKDGDRKGKTLGLRSGGTETSHVRQSFSHGRTKSVTVEHKRKRLVPKPGSPAGGQGGRPGSTPNLSEAEFERRRAAVEAAHAQEAERKQREVEATQAREAELARLRAEREAAEREAREREI